MLKRRYSAVVLAIVGLICLSSLGITGCRPQASAGPGMQLLYVSSEGTLVLADIGDPPGAKITFTELHHVGEGEVEAAWSPDGERIIVRHQETFDRLDLWIYEVNSGEATPLVQGYEAHGFGRVNWLPDDEYFVFDDGTSPARALTLFKVSEAAPIAVLGYYAWYAWSPTGDQIAYSRERVVDPPTFYESGQSADVAIYDIGTGETTPLIEGTSEFFYKPLAWPAPDSLLVSRNRAQERPPKPEELFSYNPQDPDSTPQPLEALPRHMKKEAVKGIVPAQMQEDFMRRGQYDWSADLVHVAISVVPPYPGDAEVWVLSADGSQAFKVAADVLRGFGPLWRPGKDQLTGGDP